MNAATIRVGYDSEGFQQKFGGVSRYFCEMIRRLPDDIQWALPFVETHNEYLKNAPFFKTSSRMYFDKFLRGVPKTQRVWLYRAYKVVSLLSSGLLPAEEIANFRHVRKMIDSGRLDLIHFTGPQWLGRDWRYAIGRIPYVVTIHDLIPELFGVQPEAVAERRAVLENAAHIIAVSQWTKNDVIRLYGIPPDKVSVIYHGPEAQSDAEFRPIQGIVPRQYLLYVGARDPYKNWTFFVQAVAKELVARNLTLVCTGRPFSKDEEDLLNTCGIRDCVRQVFCCDEELAWLYGNAVGFVYPSKYEGFGIPILEAFSHRCPVALSRCSCFPEIAGDAALYFEDGDETGLRNCVEALFDDAVRQRLIRLGTVRCADFSWDRSAKQTAEVYRRVIRNEI